MDDSRTAIMNLLQSRPGARLGLREVNIWPDTLSLWVEQGYPQEEIADSDRMTTLKPVDWVRFFGYDMARANTGFDFLPIRGYHEVLEDKEEWVIARNGGGATFKRWKYRSGAPEHIAFRMTSREVWERDYRSQLLDLDPLRLDVAGTRKLLELRRSQGLYTYFQDMFIWETMRQTMGDICMYESIALEPEWLLDFNRVYTNCYKAHFAYLFENVGLPDGIRLCEDLGYKNGLFCSPRHLERLFFPFYTEIVDFFHQYGLCVELHSCGNVTQALPLIVKSGFDALNPLEVKAGCDALRFAEQYADRLAFFGGLDVRVLESG